MFLLALGLWYLLLVCAICLLCLLLLCCIYCAFDWCLAVCWLALVFDVVGMPLFWFFGVPGLLGVVLF